MRRIGYLLALVLLAVVGLFVMVNVHEMAHTAAARAGGDPGAVYYLYRRYPGGDCLGCNIYDERRLGYAANLAVTVAGVLVTQVAALGVLAAAGRRRPETRARAVLLVLAGVCFLDLPLQVGQALAADVAHQSRLTRVDLADTLYLIGTRVPVTTSVLKAALAAAALLLVWTAVVVYRASAHRSRTRTLAPLRAAV